MKILLDTHILLWWLTDDPRLKAKAKKLIANPANEIFASAATGWEIAIKQSLGKITIEGNLEKELEGQGILLLPVTFAHAGEIPGLPSIHRDPFDRMLVAQARTENLHLLTVDRNILRYPANVIEG